MQGTEEPRSDSRELHEKVNGKERENQKSLREYRQIQKGW